MRVTELHHVAHLLSGSDTRCTNPNPEEPSSEPTDPTANGIGRLCLISNNNKKAPFLDERRFDIETYV